jgi:hypothetical protein
MDKAQRGASERDERHGETPSRRGGKIPPPEKRPMPTKASVIVFPAQA